MIDRLECISYKDEKKLEELKNNNVNFIDFFDLQVDELCEARNPSIRDNIDEMMSKKKEYKAKYSKEKIYCYLPWKNLCVVCLSEDLFFEVRTARNRDLITKKEQGNFRDASIAIAGLSVGSNIARICVLQGGPKKINIADADVIGLSNLNRIINGIDSIGKKKTQALAEKLYEMDPYLNIVEFDNGVNNKNVDDFIHNDGEVVKLIVEEVDDLPAKIVLREYASKHKIPLFSITDNGDGIIVDIERYDEDYEINDFYKRMEKIPKEKNNLKIQDIAKVVTNFIGVDDVDTNMLDSVSRVGKDIYSWPQVGGTAVLAGVVGAYIVRQILNEKKLSSGRYLISLTDIFSIYGDDDKELRQELLNYFKN
ncbi:MAG: hypothetical protein A2725_02820 [Candidatus Magasanikbacteria bacterium RIFCSPHIGHO2_01_FULL_33_34]|uniref:THIF-type NAD/FAD binding fold domain-containing protein n=1 Tax=Candidatus Magasanikbacteria bacterium RIFCSPHIGHO2_01_FULL_33_34 TaxID=1798671 RepID=A0A1F6LGN3_9BACT|nr:MAG: hypothetical protein A2725_02820 [Candidatus Magasanikbacteria bacterium RIFCSPHIGHO2_01_FULL_33_34]OGH66067.1 MAG: hypothetical protein A3B83_00310 [Candidatus Magasanikbacteria bacterium RIFCSPHIGHO2_02_FULL_33_17]OGH75913.1 MAG: hypothetical protein A3A89_00220 [Candidatus Magasanikbacteria bacterium RIFCSPLOWO2_01_FULL_33_34]OGH81690.1 MAG: hypothetical protein A3F93_02015 [Candidatus Magasanikbacteria bacterium RIFCSPLOWO2_12_FULL_34_7]